MPFSTSSSVRHANRAVLLAVLACTAALAGCAATPSAAPGESQAPCAKFAAASNDFVDRLATSDPQDGSIDSALTSMSEAAAFASGDIQQALGDVVVSIPASPANLTAAQGHRGAKAVNKALAAAAEACKAAGTDVPLHSLPEG
jgi:hypothetical protein